jgi:CRISPR/Cas system CMR subunit Cmr6 (Cas7 group RAMP superfamily)
VDISEKQIFKKEIFKDEIINRAERNWKRNLETEKMHCLLRTVQMEDEFFKMKQAIKYVFLKTWFSLLESQLLASATFLTPVCCLPDILTDARIQKH